MRLTEIFFDTEFAVLNAAAAYHKEVFFFLRNEHNRRKLKVLFCPEITPFKGFEKKLSDMTDNLNRMQTDLNEAHAAKGKPFEHAEELAEKSARLEQLNLELEVGKAEDVIMNDDEEQAQSAPVKTEEIGKSAPKPKR